MGLGVLRWARNFLRELAVQFPEARPRHHTLSLDDEGRLCVDLAVSVAGPPPHYVFNDVDLQRDGRDLVRDIMEQEALAAAERRSRI